MQKISIFFYFNYFEIIIKKIKLPGKSFLTNVALIRFFTTEKKELSTNSNVFHSILPMYPKMQSQSFLHREGFAAHLKNIL